MQNGGANKAIPIVCEDRRKFYKLWLSFLTPIHHFTPKVIEVAAELLRHREELSKIILDEGVLTKNLLSPDIRNQIIKDCGITLSTFWVTMNKLKKGGFFKNGIINPKLIPNIGDSSEFNFMLMFKINGD